MDDHVEQVEALFSAAKMEFKRLEHFCFHNCLYDFVWKTNRRRTTERTLTMDPAAQVWPRLPPDLRRRRRDEPVRDRDGRRQR